MRRDNSASSSMERSLMTRDSCEGLELGAAEASVTAAAPDTHQGAQPPAAGGPPQHLCCPVSLELMQDPVVVATGTHVAELGPLGELQRRAGSHNQP
jgi:hypothetical protein